jgi:hypothetical protein
MEVADSMEVQMKLLTKELRSTLPPLYEADGDLDAPVVCKFFTPWAGWTWYAFEFDGEDEFFGLVDGLEMELGSFSLSELESINGPVGLRVERDLHYRAETKRDLFNRLGLTYLTEAK